MELLEYVSARIRDLRRGYAGGEGISQEALARGIDVAANTVSRWETGTYRPDISDLDKLARFFGVSILEFFPREEAQTDDHLAALLRAAKGLKPEDLDELRRYAEFRRARSLYTGGVRPEPGRKRKKSG